MLAIACNSWTLQQGLCLLSDMEARHEVLEQSFIDTPETPERRVNKGANLWVKATGLGSGGHVRIVQQPLLHCSEHRQNARLEYRNKAKPEVPFAAAVQEIARGKRACFTKL